MKAAVLYQPGGPGNFVLEERSKPIPIEGQLLVKVKAFGLNRSELMTRKGFSPDVKFPRVLGIECVGEIEEDPSGEFKKGQRIAAFMGGMGRDYDGSYAEYTVIPKQLIFPFESILSWDKLGAMPEMFQTVYSSLHLALKIREGDTILIRGGTSSIGMLATQLAKQSGLKVLATTRNPAKETLLLNNGANHVLIDDGSLMAKVKTLYPQGVDKILELIGTSTLFDSMHCTAQFGTVCMTGMLSEQWSLSDFAPMEFIPATVHLTIYDSGQIRVDGKHFQQFIRDVEAGRIHLNLNRTYYLDDIAEAHRTMESNSGAGKIVVLTN
jgi:NADPH:quinone reductase-like Zn-dependent oxidoreductase